MPSIACDGVLKTGILFANAPDK